MIIKNIKKFFPFFGPLVFLSIEVVFIIIYGFWANISEFDFTKLPTKYSQFEAFLTGGNLLGVICSWFIFQWLGQFFFPDKNQKELNVIKKEIQGVNNNVESVHGSIDSLENRIKNLVELISLEQKEKYKKYIQRLDVYDNLESKKDEVEIWYKKGEIGEVEKNNIIDLLDLNNYAIKLWSKKPKTIENRSQKNYLENGDTSGIENILNKKTNNTISFLKSAIQNANLRLDYDNELKWRIQLTHLEPSVDNYYKLAFLQDYLKKHSDSIKNYNNTLDLLGKIDDSDQTKRNLLGETMQRLGGQLIKVKRFEEAQNVLEEAVEVQLLLLDNNNLHTFNNLAGTYNCLASLFQINTQLEKAIKYYKLGMELLEPFSKMDLMYIRVNLGYFYHNQGILYSKLGKKEEAKTFFKKALEVRRKNFVLEPNTYSGDLANTLFSIGTHYTIASDGFIDSEAALTEALIIYRNLLKKYGKSYLPEIAQILSAMGVHFAHRKNHEKAKTYFQESFEVLKRLVNEEPEVYNEHLNAIKIVMNKFNYNK